MRIWQEIKGSRNYPRLKASLEMRFAKRSAITYSVITGLCTLMVSVPALLTEDPGVIGLTVTMMLLFLSPFALFYIYRIFKIYHHIDDYTFTEAALTKPHGGFNRMMYFTVAVKDRNGREFMAETHEIFYTHGMMEPLLEDYVNKTVLIGYNNTTEYVVVIG